jgi:psp operon transcriptional activator
VRRQRGPGAASSGQAAPERDREKPDLETLALPSAVKALQVRRMRDALRSARHNQRRAAEKLGLTYDQFRGLYRKYADAVLDA